MSDPGRKSMVDKAKETVTPESAKSNTDKVKEGITDMGDKGASHAQPNSNKSATQEAADKGGSGGGSVIDSAKNAVGMNNK